MKVREFGGMDKGQPDGRYHLPRDGSHARRVVSRAYRPQAESGDQARQERGAAGPQADDRAREAVYLACRDGLRESTEDRLPKIQL